jgi:hypothetical protein
MLLSCIDPGMISPVYKDMEEKGLGGKYTQFCIAGVAIAVVAPKFVTWRTAFWDNTAATFQLHRIDRVITSIIAIAVRQESPTVPRVLPRRRRKP